MFQKFTAWVKEVIYKMLFNSATVKQALNVDTLVSPLMANELQRWYNAYINQAEWLGGTVASLNLPATIASELARSVTIEMKVGISGSARAEYLSKQFSENVFPKLREKIEMGLALGGLIIKPRVQDKTVAIDFVTANRFIPISFDDNGKLTGCAFVYQNKKNDKFYTRLEYHQMGKFSDQAGNTVWGCAITNVAFRSYNARDLGQKISLKEVDEWVDLEPSVIIKKAQRLLLAYFKTPFANNIDPTSPLGVSAYSRAMSGENGLIKQADEQWSRFIWENKSGERALFADTNAFEKGKDGKPVLPDLRLYKTLKRNGTIGDKASLFDEWSPQIRNAELLVGLDAILKKIELTCGLAFGTISDPNVQPLTATEIVMSKQRTAATITDCQKAVEKTINDLLWAMDDLCDLYGLAPQGKFTTSFEFDDSVILDSATKFTQDSVVVGMGGMPKRIFVQRNYGLDAETAKQWVAEATEERDSGLSGLFGNTNPDMTGV